jgi:hypothetical protein
MSSHAVDADACCEAMSRPGMRFVPVKSAEQQATLMLHKARELLVKQRTMSVNALRGHLSEFGIIAAKGIGRVDELLDLVESDTTLPNPAPGQHYAQRLDEPLCCPGIDTSRTCSKNWTRYDESLFLSLSCLSINVSRSIVSRIP